MAIYLRKSSYAVTHLQSVFLADRLVFITAKDVYNP